MSFNEEHVVSINLAPQGMLEPITNLKDKDGKPIQWKDYARQVDLDDPFFKRLDVAVRANADFAKLPLDSVEVLLEYQEGQTHETGEFSFTTPDSIQHFKTYIENNNASYTYSYQVNYKDQTRTYTSGPKPGIKDTFLTINVGDTGILMVDALPGDLNFAQVTQALVTLTYDAGGDIGTIERQFIMDKNNLTHSIREVVFAPVDKPYNYSVKYIMNDGREF